MRRVVIFIYIIKEKIGTISFFKQKIKSSVLSTKAQDIKVNI